MINTFFLEGTIEKISELSHTEKGIARAFITLKSKRPFRSAEGEYVDDFIEVELWRGIAEVCIENCEYGTLLGIQGRIQTSVCETKEGKPFICYKFVAEKVSFLETKK